MSSTRTRYTPEFRAQAVALVMAQGMTLESAAAHVAVPQGTLGNWVVAARRANAAADAASGRTVEELALENARLRKALMQARMDLERLQYQAQGPTKAL